MTDSGPSLVDVLELRRATIERRCREFDEVGAFDRDPAEEFALTPHVHPTGPGEADHPADLARPPSDADDRTGEGEPSG